MTNYATEARRSYLVNNFDKILNSLNSLHSTVEAMGLFVNDQVYNYIVKIEPDIRKSPLYKQRFKKMFNDICKEIRRYNNLIYTMNKKRSMVVADITQVMEDELRPYIENLSQIMRDIIRLRSLPSDRAGIAVLMLTISSLAAVSGRIVSAGYEIIREMGGGQGGNPFLFLDIGKIEYLATELSNEITGGEIQLEEDEARKVSDAMDIFLQKMSDEKIVDKIIEVISETKEEENK